MDVEVDGKPTNVQWFKDGRPLGPGEDLGNGHYRLMVPELKDDGDFGKYSVQVSNGAGSADSTAAVIEAGRSFILLLKGFISNYKNITYQSKYLFINLITFYQ